MNRRGFIKTATGLLLAVGAGELLLPERRVWALDRTMVEPRFATTGWVEHAGAWEIVPIALREDGSLIYHRQPWHEIADRSRPLITSFKVEMVANRWTGELTSAVARTRMSDGSEGPVVVLR